MKTIVLKKGLQVLCGISLLVTIGWMLKEWSAAAAGTQITASPAVPTAAPPTVNPAGPTRKQTKTYPVINIQDVHPKVVWYQLDNGYFRAGSEEAGSAGYDPYVDARNIGSTNNPYPAITSFTGVTDMEPYAPTVFKDANNVQHAKDDLVKWYISTNTSEHSFVDDATDDAYEGESLAPNGDLSKKLVFKVKTGGPSYTTQTPFSVTTPGTPTKYTVEYEFRAKITWRGEDKQTKEIRIVGDEITQVGESTLLRGEVLTQGFEGSDTWYAVNPPSAVWSSDRSAVVSVTPSGTIEAHREGTAKITVRWQKDGYDLIASRVIRVGCAGESCEASDMCVPQPGLSRSQTSITPDARGEIRADARGAEQFDVSKGIPSSDALYANVFGKAYLFDYTFDQEIGTCTFKIPVTKTYTLKWETEESDGEDADGNPRTRTVPHQETETVTNIYDVERPFAYWEITTFDAWGLKQATLNQYALPYGAITLLPSGYTAPDVQRGVTDEHMEKPPYSAKVLAGETIDGGSSRPSVPSEDWTEEAEEQVGRIKVWNDRLDFDGSVIMDDVQQDDETPETIDIVEAEEIGEDVLYESGLIIPGTRANSRDEPSDGILSYDSLLTINGEGDVQTFPIDGLNTVTVHTPVVNDSEAPDENRGFDQSVIPNMARTVLVLGREFSVDFDETAPHLNQLGYGNRDYARYTRNKRIVFPFDVYHGSTFYPAQTWIDYPVGAAKQTYRIPVWVPEGNYDAVTQAWAINTPDGSSAYQTDFNGDLANYGASRTLLFTVQGRISDFTITDIGDLRYESVFRTAKGSKQHSGYVYESGGRTKDREETVLASQPLRLLPIRPGSHPREAATVPHNGYPISFYFETIGSYSGKDAGIQIQPSFWFVSKQGGSAQEVDLYYDVSGPRNKLIKVGSARDQELYSRTYQLADLLRGVTTTSLSQAASYEYDYLLSPANRFGASWEKFWKHYITRKTVISAGYGLEELPYASRTLVGPSGPQVPASVNAVQAMRSVQRWYGEYSLPIAPYVLPKGTTILEVARQNGGALNGSEAAFLKNGYLMVHFDLSAYQQERKANPEIRYDAPMANMWEIEGQPLSSVSYSGQTYRFQYGDIAMFESSFSVRNDFQGTGR
ncbi:hypothetical protein BBD42_03885 [Paenibacillus sp. BIHB 4019]|uniref:DUF5704 domain-containing protein n=1 Tax=Paenibacillus sp. BIHB 4019 TaxID=1870819 RepID=A0A1B2DDA3_9BACL|nr:DUF5704 domain-containing protein [Paenibacillus sp. BIHB 4019]ANY65697.1 hypothetical protein BBD42_03885 [Paenibacillus sp. BIHB 4019]